MGLLSLVTNVGHFWGRGKVIKFSYRGVNRNCWKNLQVLIFFLQHNTEVYIYNIFTMSCVSMQGLVCGAEVKQFNSKWLVSNMS